MGIRNFPYQILDETLANRVPFSSLRALAGNGMHAAAVGNIILFALGAFEWVKAPSGADAGAAS